MELYLEISRRRQTHMVLDIKTQIFTCNILLIRVRECHKYRDICMTHENYLCLATFNEVALMR